MSTPDESGSRIARGAGTLAAGQLARFALQFGALIVLSRLLTPSEFGLVAMVTVVIGLGELFRDFGLSSAAIQAPSLSQGQRSNLFWINVLIGCVLSLILWASADGISAFYGADEVASIARAISPIFLVTALATQFRANLNREMRFGSLAFADVVGQAVGLCAGIGVAVAGGGYWALVVQQLCQVVVGLLCLVGASRWRPGLPRRGQEMASLYRFGGNLMGTQLLGYFSRNVDNLVIGRMLGSEALGVYSRAFQVLMLPLSQINAPSTTLAFPVLSRAQADPANFRRLVLKAQNILLVCVFGIVSAVLVSAPFVVDVLLGDEWSAAAPIVRILCLAGAAQSASFISYWMFLALGLTGSHLRYTLATRPLLIGAVLVGAQWGTTGVAVSYSVGLFVMWPTSIWWLRKAPGVDVKALLAGSYLPFAIFLSAGLLGASAHDRAASHGGLLALGVGMLVWLVCVSIALTTIRPFRSSLKEVVKFLSAAVRQRGRRTRKS